MVVFYKGFYQGWADPQKCGNINRLGINSENILYIRESILFHDNGQKLRKSIDSRFPGVRIDPLVFIISTCTSNRKHASWLKLIIYQSASPFPNFQFGLGLRLTDGWRMCAQPTVVTEDNIFFRAEPGLTRERGGGISPSLPKVSSSSARSASPLAQQCEQLQYHITFYQVSVLIVKLSYGAMNVLSYTALDDVDV